MASQLTHSSAVTETPQVKSAFFDAGALPWTPWVMEDTYFKLLSINPRTGGFTMMLKVGPNNEAPIHGHLGSVEGLITAGGFGYGDDQGKTGDYVLEEGGINHRPHTGADGMEMFAVAHAPLCGYEEDGSIGGIVDARLMYDLAEQAGAADHIDKPVHWG